MIIMEITKDLKKEFYSITEAYKIDKDPIKLKMKMSEFAQLHNDGRQLSEFVFIQSRFNSIHLFN